MSAQRALTRSSAQLIAFLPAYATAMRPLSPAIHRLEQVLVVNQAAGAAAVQAVYVRKEAALWHFKSVLGGIEARLRPPEVLRPNHQAQLGAVHGMSAAAGRLATALRQGDTSQIPALIASFDRAAAGPEQLSVQRAQIRAIRAYDAQISRLDRLAGQAQPAHAAGDAPAIASCRNLDGNVHSGRPGGARWMLTPLWRVNVHPAWAEATIWTLPSLAGGRGRRPPGRGRRPPRRGRPAAAATAAPPTQTPEWRSAFGRFP